VYQRHAYEKVGELITSNKERVLEDVQEIRIDWEGWWCHKIIEEFELKSKDVAEGIKVERGNHTCRSCKSKETYFYRQQTRSGDEGMTTFVICTKCGKRWTE
jgi:DNA-directed RNA polymerase subunit M/transcription elongation factor TFIIS